MKRTMNSFGKKTLRRLVPIVALVFLAMCCGCPPRPPSQEEQRQAVTSRWITVECSHQGKQRDPCLDHDDLKAITNTVPAMSTVIVERVRMRTIAADKTEIQATVTATGPEYLSLLEVGARVSVQQGRFLESVDTEDGAAVIVVSSSLAGKLFRNADPVSESVILDDRRLTVVGVVTDGAQWGSDIRRDAYVPLNRFEKETDQTEPFRYDRFRFRVRSLDLVKSTEAIIQKIIEQRHPDQNVRVRSSLLDRK